MIFDFIDHILNFLRIFPDEKKAESSENKETNNSITISLVLLSVSIIILIANKELFYGEHLTFQIMISLALAFLFSIFSWVLSIRMGWIQPMQILNFIIMLASSTLFLGSLIVLSLFHFGLI